MYRDDYARAGYKVLPSGSEKSRLMKWQSVLPAAALVPVTVVALILRQAGPVFVIGILLLGLAFLFSAVRLAVVRSNRSARELLLSSVVYLPLVFVLEVLARM
jgi:protoheme IX farnesyltransferase